MQASIHIDLARATHLIDDRIYSGFTEHMGRCIYGGLVGDDQTDGALIDLETGFRTDVLAALKDELKLNQGLVRYPGGNFVSSYRWQDGIGAKATRPRRLELAWRGEESNQFGTDEFMTWCSQLGAEPFICLNMGTGTLESALDLLEYLNGSSDTYWAGQRRKNGHPEPYRVKYIALGNEVWGPWQVGQMSAHDYAKAARQWAKALKFLDPSIKLVSCGKEGYDSWDWVVLHELVDVVDYHSLHLYTKGSTHDISVMGSAAAEKAIKMTMEVVDLARIAKGTNNRPKICFDEWNVWDPVIADGEKGAEQVYTMSDALSVASWLNVFVRSPDVAIACIAQTVNVISPLMTSPSGLLRQTTYFPLMLFAHYMHGSNLDIFVNSPCYDGPTDLAWVQQVCAAQLTWIDAACTLDEVNKKLNVVIVNRHGSSAFAVRLALGGVSVQDLTVAIEADVECFELHHADITAANTWENKEKVKPQKSTSGLADASVLQMAAGSFKLLRFELVAQ